MDSRNRKQGDPEQQVRPDRFISFPERVGPAFWLSTGWILLVAILALAADFLPLVGYDHMDFARQASPPGTVSQISMNSGNGNYGEKPYIYILGMDTMGRDIASRLIFGARVSMAVGFAAPFIGLVLGSYPRDDSRILQGENRDNYNHNHNHNHNHGYRPGISGHSASFGNYLLFGTQPEKYHHCSGYPHGPVILQGVPGQYD